MAAEQGPEPSFDRYRAIIALTAFFASRTGTGLFGVGGGFLIIPVLVMVLGLPVATATATSLVVISVNSAAGAWSRTWTRVAIDYRFTITFTVAAIVGSILAARLAVRLPADRLRRWFAFVVLAVALGVTVQTVTAALT